jgi:hypothetical protein
MQARWNNESWGSKGEFIIIVQLMKEDDMGDLMDELMRQASYYASQYILFM